MLDSAASGCRHLYSRSASIPGKAGTGPGILLGTQACPELDAARKDACSAEGRALGRPRRQPPSAGPSVDSLPGPTVGCSILRRCIGTPPQSLELGEGAQPFPLNKMTPRAERVKTCGDDAALAGLGGDHGGRRDVNAPVL